MRYKVVPPVRSVEFLRQASDCLPLIPGTVEDCCSRIRDGTDLQARDDAREYLTFLRALELACRAEAGYYRPRDPPADDELGAAFLEGVYGAREAVTALDGPRSRSADAVFETAIEPVVPRWERDRAHDWRGTWRERTERLLDWAGVLDLVKQIDGESYRRSE